MNIHCIFVVGKKEPIVMNIAKLIYTVIIMLVFTSCVSEYQIQGSSSVSRLDGKMLFVKVPQGNDMMNVDSAEVVHGMFKMQGEIDTTMIASLYMDDQSIMPLVMEKWRRNIILHKILRTAI